MVENLHAKQQAQFTRENLGRKDSGLPAVVADLVMFGRDHGLNSVSDP